MVLGVNGLLAHEASGRTLGIQFAFVLTGVDCSVLRGSSVLPLRLVEIVCLHPAGGKARREPAQVEEEVQQQEEEAGDVGA